MTTCANCKWWDGGELSGRSLLRRCNNPKLRNDGTPPYEDVAGVDSGYGLIETGPNFGCVHGAEKEVDLE